MLDPNERHIYIQALRPPFGYSLDHAVATTYSLDLMTLLAVPLSFAKFQLKKKDEFLKDPVAILEALRRLTGRFHVFCQRGGIKVPGGPNLLFQYLEKAVVDVRASDPEGIFHPKLWVLRFVDDKKKKVYYRLLCLSRNITFDTSWDTILTLEGEVRGRFYAKNKPLSDFIRALPGLAVRRLKRADEKKIKEMAEEVRHVCFELPPGFAEYKFWPMGVGKDRSFPIRNDFGKLLVVSPFLSEDFLATLTENEGKRILISRVEEIDMLSPEMRARFEKIYYFAGEMEKPEDIDSGGERAGDEPAETVGRDDKNELAGLHAKIFLADKGWHAYLWAGSANATRSAFSKNIEFLVELKGWKSRKGIDRFLYGGGEGKASMMDLLEEYREPEKPVKEDETQKRLERELDKIQKMFVNCDFHARCGERPDGLYDLTVAFSSGIKYKGEFVCKGRIWPVSLMSGNGQDLPFPGPLGKLVFPELSVDKITGFFAFHLEIKEGRYRHGTEFVLNLPVMGLPSYRDQRILQIIVSSQENFLRYLLLLLFEGDPFYLTPGLEKKIRGIKGRGIEWLLGEDLPLFEELVRAFSRSPEKIERISALLKDISKTEEGRKMIPEEFTALWNLFVEEKRKL
ncbi:MAG: phospholipase D family protein [Candidatus Aminicenantes bacterium]|nr:phospholipase D family protein [Candidatus Aminicenantes bacterium]